MSAAMPEVSIDSQIQCYVFSNAIGNCMILGFSVTPAVMPEVSIDSRIQCYVCSNARGNY